MIKTVRPKNWAELNEYLFDDTWDPDIRRHRSNFAYRGMSNFTWALENSLSRVAGPSPYEDLEKNLTKQFRKYSTETIPEDASDWHLLSIAQHVGLPTRLLDWSYSPYVALHFATDNTEQYDVDGVVWKVNYKQAHTLVHDDLKARLREHGSSIFTVDNLDESIEGGMATLDGWHREAHPVAIFFEPPALDQRIVSQFAYFSLISDRYLNFDKWLNHRDVKPVVDALKIRIPKKLKWEVRDKLDQSNINERILFPGLDGLATWLRRHYYPRRP